MNEVDCRKATESDLPAIIELWLEMMEFHRDAMPAPLVENAAEIYAAYTRQGFALDACLILVAERDGAVVGCCRAAVTNHPPVYEARPYGYINQLVVAAAQRRQGVGEALYVATKEWFLDRGINRLEVGTATCNPVSNAFWGKMGFETYRETKQLDL